MNALLALQNTPISISSAEYGLGSAYFRRITTASFRVPHNVANLDCMPVEILTRILLLSPDRFDERPERWAKSVLLLGCVCSEWLRLVTTTPSFNCSIAITHFTSPDSLKALLGKSKSAKLSLAFWFTKASLQQTTTFDNTLETISELIVPVINRCTWISITCDDELTGHRLLRCLSSTKGPRVTCATVEIPSSVIRVDELQGLDEQERIPSTLFGGDTPLLQCMKLSISILPWDISVFSTLTVLHLVGIDNPAPRVDQLLAVFTAASMVEYMLISCVRCNDYVPTEPFPITDTVLPRLTHLSLHVDDSLDSCVFDTLLLPSLEQLHIRADFEEGSRGAIGHLARAGRHVQSVAFETYVNAPETMKDLLKAFPSVTKVDCRGSNTNFALLLHAAAVHWPGLWPNLSELWIDNMFPDEMHIRMMTGLTGLSRPLTSILSPMIPDTSGDITVPGRRCLNDPNEEELKLLHLPVSTDMPVFSA
ncbi:hypothetical protein R3P38DRAFT_2810712 [Favolaschia claudopus]|uniref:F-box domain-containing protein n=1 Tax=Favolaschia claudopus TaxID=2862362 RepID=A0AAV9ZB08_9AGAR